MKDRTEPNDSLDSHNNIEDKLAPDLVKIQQRQKLEIEVREAIVPEVVPNRDFDIPEFDFSKIEESKKEPAKDAVNRIVHWLVDVHAVKDKFGTSTEGDKQRETWRNQFLANNGELGKEVWNDIDGQNKFRINVWLLPAYNIQAIKRVFDSNDSLEATLIELSEIFDSVYPYDEVYETMSYDQRTEFIHSIENKVVEFLNQLKLLLD